MTKEENGVEIKVERDGTRLWYLHGVLHRGDGPAVEWPEGDRRWYQFGKEHREDGPAIERVNGTKEWFRNGKHHRDDGPAVGGEDTKRNLKHVKDCVATRYAVRSPAMLGRTVCVLSPSRRLISRYDWPSATSVRTRGT